MLQKLLLLSMVVLLSYSAKSQSKQINQVQVVNFEQLEPFLHKTNDTVYLVNFWATWCAPCIKELPAIKDVEDKYKNGKFKVLLVSLDFPRELKSKLQPFVNSKNITSKVFLLNAPNQNQWIDKVDASWSGAIPFTLIYSKNSRESYSQPFTFEQLNLIVNQKLKKP
jgi:thiol-disulfide isomerase/thioredoxin